MLDFDERLARDKRSSLFSLLFPAHINLSNKNSVIFFLFVDAIEK
jgi:hypothetical protein